MTLKTKIFFLIIVGLASAAVVAILSLEKSQVYTLPTRGGVNVDITVAVAPQIEDWVRTAATDFNGRNSQISVQVIGLKGLDAVQALDLSQQDSLPDAWIAEADFVRQIARNVPYDAQGTSLAQDSLLWVAIAQRTGLNGALDWDTVYIAATDSAQWQTLGMGDSRFDAALPSPANSIEGVAAYLSAAATYHQQPNLNANMVGDANFLRWMDDILLTVPEKRVSPINQLTRTPPSVDVGIVLQSRLTELNASQFIQQPPAYNVLLNFPYLIRRENPAKDAADREVAAQTFLDFLTSPETQNQLHAYGLQPANAFATGGQFVTADSATIDRLRAQFK